MTTRRSSTAPRGYFNRGAYFSPCGRYRYSLWRDLGEGDGEVCFVMLNPSTADAATDDPTIRRCVGYARAWGYFSLKVVNLFAWRSTDPSALRTEADPVGPQNDEIIRETVAGADLTVCAWGQHGSIRRRDRAVIDLLEGYKLTALRLAKNGAPSHPLYLPAALQPVPFQEPRA